MAALLVSASLAHKDSHSSLQYYTLMMKGTPEWLYTLYSVSADITPTKTQSYIMIFGAGDITVINSKMKQKQVTIFICCFQNLQKSFSLVLMIKRPGNILHTIK